jgi:hypothetical protein
MLCAGLFFSLFLPVQDVLHHRKIDAHQVQVTGTVSYVSRGKLHDSYQATYTYGDREVKSDSFFISRYASKSDTLCLEIDGTSPERARPCGDRYRFRTFWNLTMGGLYLLGGAALTRRKRPKNGGITGQWGRRRRAKVPVPAAANSRNTDETAAGTGRAGNPN